MTRLRLLYKWLDLVFVLELPVIGDRSGRLAAAGAPRKAMSDILFIKTSSLGDVVHHMPAATEARRHVPDGRITWVVEEAFAPLVAMHPAIDAVITVASRRWRSATTHPDTRREVRAFVRELRSRRFDQIIDSQGLYRSAFIARLARGRRHGYDMRSIREPIASLLYDVRHKVDRGLHAIARNRQLTGLALGYVPDDSMDFGFDRASLVPAPAERYAVLLHATARPEKEWSVERWIALGSALEMRGYDVVLPWGSEIERVRSRRIAAVLQRARIPDWEPVDGVARLIAGASLVVGVDTGFLHVAAAFGVPLVAVFGASVPELTGPMGTGAIEIVGSENGMPGIDEVIDAVGKVV